MHGYICLPMIGSAFVEVRREWVGFGIEHHRPRDRTFYLGWLEIAFSASANPRPGLTLAAAFVVLLLAVIGSSFTTAPQETIAEPHILDVPIFHSYPLMDNTYPG